MLLLGLRVVFCLFDEDQQGFQTSLLVFNELTRGQLLLLLHGLYLLYYLNLLPLYFLALTD